jgi:hypothetical protein
MSDFPEMSYVDQGAKEIELPSQASSLDFLRALYRNPRLPLSVRMKAAIAALPFETPKLAVTANLNVAGFADRMERMMTARGLALVIDARPNFSKEAD